MRILLTSLTNTRFGVRITGGHTARSARASDEALLNLDQLATVEVTSEEDGYPIEAVFAGKRDRGWRAGHPGEQMIRLVFDRPVELNRIQLRFDESRADYSLADRIGLRRSHWRS